MTRRFSLVALLISLVAAGSVRAQEDFNENLEKEIKAAVKKASPSVVQIVTQGGADMVALGPKGAAFRKALGPTTGVIVSPDGYLISSLFNFINNPTTILVSVPGHPEPFVAKKIANDRSRLLTLLKIEAKNLTVPAWVPKKEMQEGQWSLALGRTLDTKRDNPPSVSVGILSALNRIWSKAIQTDCKVSPVNYGGPIIDITGRVQGILIPANPNGTDETAGFEWYDSGIGFAIPLEDVMSVLPRLKEGKDLKKGILGVRMKSQDMYSSLPEVADVAKDSAAAKAGLKGGDIITAINGQPVVRMAQIQHLLGPKYEGDTISLKFRRGQEEITVDKLELVAGLQVVAQGYLGMLPLRDDPKLGVEVRYVFPKSPADKAGLKPGDRIVKYGVGPTLTGFQGAKPGRAEFTDFLNAQTPGTEIKIEVARKDNTKSTLAATLDFLPGADPKNDFVIPEKLPEPSTLKKALEPLEVGNPKVKPPKEGKVEKPKVETGYLKRTTADGEGKFNLWVPDEYDPNVSHAVVVWLHVPGKNKEADFKDFAEAWEDFCATNNIILVMPENNSDTGWNPADSELVVAALRDVIGKYTVDRQRIVIHGMGVGGQMALHLGFNQRELVRGAAAVGAPVTTIKDNNPAQRVSFYLAAGKLDPLFDVIAEGRKMLGEKRFPAFFREMPNRGREYLEESHIRELVRWIDSLDKQ